MKSTNVYRLFESVSEMRACSVAVEQGSHGVTYKELNEKATRIAEMVIEAAGREKSIVAIMLDPSIDYIAVVLGVLKAGHVFMPVNSSFPARRVAHILERSGAALCVAVAADTQKVLALQKQSNLHLSIIGQAPDKQSNDDFRHVSFYSVHTATADPAAAAPPCADARSGSPDACYVMATSGSSGQPKLILGSHKGLCHFVDWEIDTFGFTEHARCSLLSHTSFDVSLRDIFAPLLSGGTVCIPEDFERNTPNTMFDWLKSKRITHTHIVPTLLRAVLSALAPKADNHLPSLAYALIAGEPMYGSDVENWRSRVNATTRLVNLYGPSETTLATFYYPIPHDEFSATEMIPIGRPIPDTEVMIIGEENQLCSGLEIGEIYIATRYRSLGYLGDPDQEAMRFVANPLNGNGSEMVYRTGDLGQYTDGGDVKCLGRLDNQIKLNGNRIELDEVESVLRGHPDAAQAAVAIKSDTALNQRLVGYIVPRSKTPPSTESLRQFLVANLPDYMIPSAFVVLTALPLTHSNKLDRNSLPAPTKQRPILEQEYAPSRSRLEHDLGSIWMHVLNLEEIGIDDNFFDVGGTSLLAMHVIALIEERLDFDLAVTRLFQYPTIRKLGSYIESDGSSSFANSKVSDRAAKRKSAIARGRRR